MKPRFMAAFTVMCPFEIGDRVQFEDGCLKITDIVVVHSVKTGRDILFYQLDNNEVARQINGKYKKVDGVFCRVTEE